MELQTGRARLKSIGILRDIPNFVDICKWLKRKIKRRLPLIARIVRSHTGTARYDMKTQSVKAEPGIVLEVSSIEERVKPIAVKGEIKPLFTNDDVRLFLGRQLICVLQDTFQSEGLVKVVTYTLSKQAIDEYIKGVKAIILYDPENGIVDYEGDNVDLRAVEGVRLHAKIYYVKLGLREKVYLSSANLTRDGLERNYEFLLEVNEPTLKGEVKGFIEALMDGRLVETRKLLWGERLAQTMRDILDRVNYELTLIVPFIDNNAVKKILELQGSSRICRSLAHRDLWSRL